MLLGGVYGYGMVDGILTPDNGGSAVWLVYRGALSTEYCPAGFVIEVVSPNDPSEAKVSTIPWPKWSKYKPAPARIDVLWSGEYATARRGAKFVSCIFQ